MSLSQTRRLLITSGNGPRECRLAVGLCLAFMQKEASQTGVGLKMTQEQHPENDEAPSALVTVDGKRAAEFATSWLGSVCWTCQSPFRPHHKRRNWFIGIFAVDGMDNEVAEIDERDLRYETFRAGGPGGQHQNTTDSAVRLTHIPSGIAIVSRDERSQHRNKQTARNRLIDQMILASLQGKAKSRAEENGLHKQLERGSPVRSFKGEKFTEC